MDGLSFTTLNLILLITSVLTYFIGDSVVTIVGLNNGMEEANPILGTRPSPYLLLGVKLGVMALCMVAIEYFVPIHQVQTARNLVYGILTALGTGIVAYNIYGIIKARK